MQTIIQLKNALALIHNLVSINIHWSELKLKKSSVLTAVVKDIAHFF